MTTTQEIPTANIRRAVFVYEAARLHALQLECPIVPKAWEDREAPFREQFVELIADLASGRRQFADPEKAHDSWVDKYLEMGWTFGEQYDPDRKTHPDLVSFGKLDPKEKIKDEVFLRLVKLAADCIW